MYRDRFKIIVDIVNVVDHWGKPYITWDWLQCNKIYVCRDHDEESGGNNIKIYENKTEVVGFEDLFHFPGTFTDHDLIYHDVWKIGSLQENEVMKCTRVNIVCSVIEEWCFYSKDGCIFSAGNFQ